MRRLFTCSYVPDGRCDIVAAVVVGPVFGCETASVLPCCFTYHCQRKRARRRAPRALEILNLASAYRCGRRFLTRRRCSCRPRCGNDGRLDSRRAEVPCGTLQPPRNRAAARRSLRVYDIGHGNPPQIFVEHTVVAPSRRSHAETACVISLKLHNQRPPTDEESLRPRR